MRENGNILVCANGFTTFKFPQSRVIELDPQSREIVWDYKGSPPLSFFSPHISGAQRLSSGNTLICEGGWGRIFEVTSDGKIVWEYISSHENEFPIGELLNWLFSADLYAEQHSQIYAADSAYFTPACQSK